MTAYNRGTLIVGAYIFSPAPNGITTNTWVITKEKVSIVAGLFFKNLPAKNSSSNFSLALWGRQREIVLDGLFVGTQGDIETFLAAMEAWVNKDASFQPQSKYYPKHNGSGYNSSGTNGIKNTSAASNQQDVYWNVLAESFSYTFDDQDPSLIKFTLVLREGTKNLVSVITGETAT